ncbi:rho-related protein racA-like [Actinia tenebrosa]|uniref:Rho-related protein racA-like n=1 Tax=Actinia tenebrosa TaxID=6105 RepID=A0A6P8HEK2_ACTTE|nr:rho-related protein racA-like [Actinia tenebrosa]
MARCDVMAAMLGGAFMEGRNSSETEIKEASLESFLAILEYLYTDHAPIEEGDAIDIMVLADRFCLPRLVTLCELYITKKVDKMIEKKVSDGAEYVVNLLLLSQAHNAHQLSNWCLHFIATNYLIFESNPSFTLVQGTNIEYVEKHRWPPLSYLNEVQEFEKKVGHTSKKGKCSIM